MPPKLNEASLEYVDLDIDLFVDSSAKITVLDEDEFSENVAKVSYPPDLVAAVESAVWELTGMVRRRDFPFDHPDLTQHSA